MPPEGAKKATRAWPVIKAYTKALWKYPWLFVAVFVTGLVAELGWVVAPIYLKRLVNIIAESEPSEAAAAAMFSILALFGLVLLVRWVHAVAQGAITSILEARVMADLERKAFNYLLGHSHDFFISNFAGALTRRVNRYAGAFEQIFDTILFNFFGTAVFAIGAMAVLFQHSGVLGGALLIWMVAFIALQVTLIRWKQPVRIARAEQDTRVTAMLSDVVTNQSTVNQFAARKYEEGRFASVMEKWRAATVRSWLTDNGINAVLSFLNIALQVLLLGGAIVLWAEGILTVGDFLLLQIYALGLIDRIWGVGRMVRRLYDAFADAHEMIAILDMPHGVQDRADAHALTLAGGKVAFRNVGFGFGGQMIFEDFSLEVSEKQKVALVGPSGAGKSTITKLLLRLYDVDGGVIEVDGQNIAEVTQDSLREAIAFVPQEPILFHRSLMDNIRYGRRDAADAEVIEASKKARCHEFITKLPLGYDTYVGERGVKLSGGERQRVAIARAILKDAPILILDEATSSLDSESEALIQDALHTLMEGKTVLVIAHRLSTIMSMDRIVVIEGGKIVADGTHAELLDQKGGLYHKLWSIQAGGFVVD